MVFCCSYCGLQCSIQLFHVILQPRCFISIILSHLVKIPVIKMCQQRLHDIYKEWRIRVFAEYFFPHLGMIITATIKRCQVTYTGINFTCGGMIADFIICHCYMAFCHREYDVISHFGFRLLPKCHSGIIFMDSNQSSYC